MNHDLLELVVVVVDAVNGDGVDVVEADGIALELVDSEASKVSEK